MNNSPEKSRSFRSKGFWILFAVLAAASAFGVAYYMHRMKRMERDKAILDDMVSWRSGGTESPAKDAPSQIIKPAPPAAKPPVAQTPADGPHFAITPEEFRGLFNARINEERIKSIKVEPGEASDVFEVVLFDTCRYIGAVHKKTGKVSQLMVMVRPPADFKELPEDVAMQEVRNMVMAIVAPASVLSIAPESEIEATLEPAIHRVMSRARKEARVSVEDLECLVTIQEGHVMSVLKPAASK